MVLLLSVRSLRKQQRAALARTMGSLYGQVGSANNGQSATGYVNVEGGDLGRKMSSFMASTGKAIEKAVTQELSNAVLDLKRTAEATVAQGVEAVAGGSEQKMK